MDESRLRKLIDDIAAGHVKPDDAMSALRTLPFESLPFATLDHHRSLRCDFPEVIYAEGKTPDQVADIFERMAERGDRILATRVNKQHAEAVRLRLPDADYHETGRCLSLKRTESPRSKGVIAIVAAGTSDLPVLEEARIVCDMMDQTTDVIVDVGVAGVHRILAQSHRLHAARVVIVIAGMDGALPSVVGGLVSAPVVAVPTSVGYGASFNGVGPLLTMLNACAPGVSVVNIDNGFGAGYVASMINRIGE
ncbi:MAG: nickel pincer cofactor biosynthesis protein LarB [Phycisphaerales bacterium]|nr:nickel pincer cofactor biosynthesis protein LarB [Phycisphaerales bacterium]MCB9857963.1 nickel pincer cofactor biosynthesis protein LarB [Phycisphaerales bacterium]MCB9864944.1 nickel pincer cofactor biosynthesis protein LarB [Phycisphaerales bacterium]